MLWKNTNQTWKSCFISVELYFPVDFDIEFKDRVSGDYDIRFVYKKNQGLGHMNCENLVLSLN